MRSKSNPFAQSQQYWNVVFDMPGIVSDAAQQAFEDIALSVSAFEIEEDGHIWHYELLCGEPPNMEEIKRRLVLLAGLFELDVPEMELVKVEQQDWLSKVARDFPPLAIGRFYVHGKHVTPPATGGIIPIQVDAGAAFGSGEHGTTRCCLEALDWLSRRREFENILDMGCGSGILAIAAAKLWKTDVLAADIDAVAVQVTEENARINRVTSHIKPLVSDGYANERIRKAAPFDLIIANILAKPLVAMAPDLAASLEKGGVVVLSGLLVSQEAYVRAAHTAQGLTLKKRFVHSDWCTLVLE